MGIEDSHIYSSINVKVTGVIEFNFAFILVVHRSLLYCSAIKEKSHLYPKAKINNLLKVVCNENQGVR